MPADVRSLHDTECASCMRVALVPCGMGQEAPLPPPPLTTAGSARSKASLSGSTWRTRWSLPRTLASGERPPKVRRPPLVLRRLPSRHPVPKRSRPRLLRPRLRTQGLSCPTPQKKCASREANPWQLELPPASDSVVLYYRKKVKYRGGETRSGYLCATSRRWCVDVPRVSVACLYIILKKLCANNNNNNNNNI